MTQSLSPVEGTSMHSVVINAGACDDDRWETVAVTTQVGGGAREEWGGRAELADWCDRNDRRGCSECLWWNASGGMPLAECLWRNASGGTVGGAVGSRLGKESSVGVSAVRSGDLIGGEGTEACLTGRAMRRFCGSCLPEPSHRWSVGLPCRGRLVRVTEADSRHGVPSRRQVGLAE